MKLYISSGQHAQTNFEGRIEAIEENLDSPDAVLFEGRQHEYETSVKIRNWLAAPLQLLGAWAWAQLLLPILRGRGNGDADIAQEIAQAHSARIYKVDKPVHDIIAERRRLYQTLTICSIPLLLPFLVMGVAIDQATVLLSGFVLLTLVMFLSFAVGTIRERDVHMANRAREISVSEDAHEACIILGDWHEAGVRNIVSQYEDLDIANTER